MHYIPGKDNILADVLSRLSNGKNTAETIPDELSDKLVDRVNQVEEINTFIPEKVPWSQELLREEQEKDEGCNKIKESLKARRLDIKLLKFKIVNKMLYVHRELKRNNVTDEVIVPIIPTHLMKDAFKIVHKDSTAGHPSYERTVNLFRRNFYNINESKIIKEMCDECNECRRAKATPKLVLLKKYPIPHRPFHTISADIMGPLPITMNNKKYVLVVRDFTTRYTIIKSLANKDTNSIINAFRQVIADYGSSIVLLTDNAKEFVSENFRKFLTYYNIRKEEITPYHPSSQGLAERINRTITKLLRIYTNTLTTTDWDELLPVIQLTITTPLTQVLETHHSMHYTDTTAQR